MLSEQQQFEIQKFFINALMQKLKPENHDQTLNLCTAKPTSPSAEQLIVSYALNKLNADIIAAALEQAVSKTQQQIKITTDNIQEVTQEIHRCKQDVLAKLFENIPRQADTAPWSALQAKLKTLDDALEVPGFYEKYKNELELVGKVAAFSVVAGLLGFGLYALHSAVTNGSSPTPPSPTF